MVIGALMEIPSANKPLICIQLQAFQKTEITQSQRPPSWCLLVYHHDHYDYDDDDDDGDYDDDDDDNVFMCTYMHK